MLFLVFLLALSNRPKKGGCNNCTLVGVRNCGQTLFLCDFLFLTIRSFSYKFTQSNCAINPAPIPWLHSMQTIRHISTFVPRRKSRPNYENKYCLSNLHWLQVIRPSNLRKAAFRNTSPLSARCRQNPFSWRVLTPGPGDLTPSRPAEQ